MGIERTYSRVARAVAERSGVGFDDHAFFAIQVDFDRLPGAISTIGSCSLEAVTSAFAKATEKAHTGIARVLVEKLESTFGADSVRPNDVWSGDSGHDWTVAATVQTGSRQLVFDVATSRQFL